MSNEHRAGGLAPFSPASYNDLLDVAVADRELNGRDDRALFFEELGSLICRHDLEKHVGVCLLHNHNDVTGGQIMVERFDEHLYGSPALVMQCTEVATAPDAVPAVMQVVRTGDGTYLMPVEYSTVDIAFRNYDGFQAKREEFVPEFRALLCSRGYENLIGLSMLRAETLPCGVGEGLVERTDLERIANVVTVEPEDMVLVGPGARLIETNWQFQRSDLDPTMACYQVCSSKCTVTTKCVVTGGEHAHWDKHNSSHGGKEHKTTSGS